MYRKFSFSVNEYYHLYNRGTDKRIIFMDAHDYRRFITLLYVCNSSFAVNISEHLQKGRSFLELINIERGDEIVDIVAYCLMPNHFHILIREKIEGGAVKFMLKLSTGYSMYFNKKNKRSGALFEGRFKAKHADTDEYLKYLFAYIHLNPIKIVDSKWKEVGVKHLVAAQDFLNNYEYSSYTDWLGKIRHESKILNKEAAPEYFAAGKDFDEYVNDWLAYREE